MLLFLIDLGTLHCAKDAFQGPRKVVDHDRRVEAVFEYFQVTQSYVAVAAFDSVHSMLYAKVHEID